MPIDWDAVDAGIDQALDEAMKRTNDRLAAQVSSLTRLTDEEVKKLFPTPADLKQLAELMQIVRSAEARNTKINRLVKNIESVSGAVVTLIDRFA